MKKAFKKTKCQFCDKEVSSGGAAFTSHMRMHVRKKEAVEYKRDGKLSFFKFGVDFVKEEPYAKLGNEPLLGQPRDAWNITADLQALPAVDPHQYFVTSGEAVRKAEKLVQDVYSLAVKARTFRDRLKKARSTKKYLETCRDNGLLIVKRKDPRFKEEKEEKEEK